MLADESAPGGFEGANKLYEEGKFAEAAAAYDRLVQADRVSPALYFNLGNAWFKSGHMGRAIAAYRRAEQLAPRDPDIRANLQFACNQVQGPTLPANPWRRWLGQLTLNEWTVLAALALWALFLMLAAVQWRPALKSSLRSPTLVCAAVAVLLGACLGAALYQQRSFRLAVVIKPEAVVRYGWLDVSQTAFSAHDGAELQVLDENNDWLQVTVGPLRTGWIRRDQVLLVR
jgi:tetratricopeptide (TPR) repeat protein